MLWTSMLVPDGKVKDCFIDVFLCCMKSVVGEANRLCCI